MAPWLSAVPPVINEPPAALFSRGVLSPSGALQPRHYPPRPLCWPQALHTHQGATPPSALTSITLSITFKALAARAQVHQYHVQGPSGPSASSPLSRLVDRIDHSGGLSDLDSSQIAQIPGYTGVYRYPGENIDPFY